MSKKFEYKNGYVGTVSDPVAIILAKRGDGRIVGDAKKPPKEDKKEDKKDEGAKE